VLLIPGLVAAQASGAPKAPQVTTRPHYEPIAKSERTEANHD